MRRRKETSGAQDAIGAETRYAKKAANHQQKNPKMNYCGLAINGTGICIPCDTAIMAV